jgi:hypothetical protein
MLREYELNLSADGLEPLGSLLPGSQPPEQVDGIIYKTNITFEVSNS